MSKEERYTAYCNNINSNFGLNAAYDAFAIVILICWDIYFIFQYQRFQNSSKHVNHISANQNDDIKGSNIDNKSKQHQQQQTHTTTKNTNAKEFRSN